MKKTIIFALGLILTNLAFAGLALENPTILYVGDSHSYGKMGTVVEKNLSQISTHVIMESSCGASANTWLGKSGFEKTVCGFWFKEGTVDERSVNHKVPSFSGEMEKYSPNVVVIQLGTNMAAGSNPANSAASIEEMMKASQINGSVCIWIGPPDANSKIVTKEKLEIVNNLLITLAEKNNCHYIDSMKLTSFPKDSKEGIHYPPTMSAQWGEKVSQAILEIIKD